MVGGDNMSDFCDFEKYIFDMNDSNWRKSKHAFFKFDLSKLISAEKALGIEFPTELVAFYKALGYGFVCNNSSLMNSRIMDPKSISDFIQGLGVFKMFPDRERFMGKCMFPFFEVSEVSMLMLDTSSNKLKGENPVYYYGKLIATSLQEFLQKMDTETDYYLNVDK